MLNNYILSLCNYFLYQNMHLNNNLLDELGNEIYSAVYDMLGTLISTTHAYIILLLQCIQLYVNEFKRINYNCDNLQAEKIVFCTQQTFC